VDRDAIVNAIKSEQLKGYVHPYINRLHIIPEQLWTAT
jgi:hypothetical protein